MYPNNYTNYIADRAVDNDENQDRRQEAETELAAALIVQQDHHIELTDPRAGPGGAGLRTGLLSR